MVRRVSRGRDGGDLSLLASGRRVTRFVEKPMVFTAYPYAQTDGYLVDKRGYQEVNERFRKVPPTTFPT